MYACIYVCTYVYAYLIYVYMRVRVRVRACVGGSGCNLCIYVSYVCMCIRMYVCMCMHI